MYEFSFASSLLRHKRQYFLLSSLLFFVSNAFLIREFNLREVLVFNLYSDGMFWIVLVQSEFKEFSVRQAGSCIFLKHSLSTPENFVDRRLQYHCWKLPFTAVFKAVLDSTKDDENVTTCGILVELTPVRFNRILQFKSNTNS